MLIDILDLITQILSLASIPLAFAGIFLMFLKVFPIQRRLSKIYDELSYERKTLPKLSSSFVILGLLISAAITYNTLVGINGHNAYTNITRMLVNLLIAHGGYSWTSLYNRNIKKGV